MRLVFILSAAFSLAACTATERSTGMNSQPALEPDFLLDHSPDFDRQNVVVIGEVVAGFDGTHNYCFVSSPNSHRHIWVNDPSCFSKDGGRGKYRKGRSMVSGEYDDIQFLQSGMIFDAPIRNGKINWRR